jgi:hypothetical protein
MASKDKRAKAGEAAAQSNRLMQRLIEDEQLRSSLFSAYDAARGAYERLGNGTPAGKALLGDAKLQEEIQNAVEAIKEAAGSLREEPVKKAPARRRRGRPLLLLLVGAGLALALSEGLRSKVLDLLFGAEEQFDYSSTTEPAAEPAGVAGA